MSGTLNNIYNNVSIALQLHTKALARLQEQVSTGSAVNRPSDDPSTAYQILGYNSQQRSLENYIDNLSDVVSTLELSSTIVQSIVQSLTEVKTNLTQITSGTYNQDSRNRVAETINDTLEQIISFANTKNMNQYLFGGSNTSIPPYTVERTDGQITRVIYQGSFEARNVEVAPGIEASAFYVGDDIFSSDSRSDPIFIGETGAKPGTGTSSVRGYVWLTVIHDGSNYKLSIDDGESYVTVPSGGDTNQAVTDSRTGQVLYVDTTEITGTGTELVCIPGTYDIFNTLITIRDTLKNEKELSESQLQNLLTNSLDSMDEIMNLISQAEVSQGAKIGFLENLEETLTDLKYNAEDETTRLQEADITQIAIDLSRYELLYEMSLSMAARLMSMSLLDFIK